MPFINVIFSKKNHLVKKSKNEIKAKGIDLLEGNLQRPFYYYGEKSHQKLNLISCKTLSLSCPVLARFKTRILTTIKLIKEVPTYTRHIHAVNMVNSNANDCRKKYIDRAQFSI